MKTFVIALCLILKTLISQDIYAPKPFNLILEDIIEKEWVPEPLSNLENRSHIVLMDNSETYCLKVNSSILGNMVIGDVSALKDGTATYGDALRSMFQILDMNTASLASDDLSGVYTIHPMLASYYALDSEMDGGQLKVGDKSSFYHTEQDTNSYLVFDFGSLSDGGTIITAVSRYVYDNDNETYQIDDNWTPYLYIKLNSDQTLSLTGQISEATEWKIMDADGLIDTNIEAGSDFNPGATEWQNNSFAAYPIDVNTGELAVWDYDESPLKTDQFYMNIDDDYQNQLGNSGVSTASASRVLDAIEQNLIDLGHSLRYTKNTYLIFREAMLSNKFGSVDLYNSKLDERTVEHVYFTSSYDDDGEYHPFMVIATHNAPSGPQFLIDVARPPGDGTPGLSYDEQTVTRNAVLEQKLVKIPLRNYGLISNLTDNNMSEYGSLAMDENVDEADWTVDNHASTSSSGIAVDGVIIYPASNNVLIYASLAAEITSTGIHVGRGMGFHYHADGHAFNGNGINLYNQNDYVGHSHPPLIGFVFDGIAIFGTYENNQSQLDGSSEDLDEYGGHVHGEYGYHHHAFSELVEQQNGPNTYSFTQNYLQRGAFKGNINNIPGFLNVNTNQFMDNELKRFVGGAGTSQLSFSHNHDFIPKEFSLYQNYPNPFNPTTQVKYDLPKDDLVSISIYDLKGRNIKYLVNNFQSAGYRSVRWDATNNHGEPVSAGLYVYVIQAGEFRASRKMILLK